MTLQELFTKLTDKNFPIKHRKFDKIIWGGWSPEQLAAVDRRLSREEYLRPIIDKILVEYRKVTISNDEYVNMLRTLNYYLYNDISLDEAKKRAAEI